MIIRRKQFSNIDWGKVKEDLEVSGTVGLLSSIFGGYYLKEKLGLSKKASIIGGIGAGIGAAALTYKLLGHDSYTSEEAEQKKKEIEQGRKIEEASKTYPWIKDILGNLPLIYTKVKTIEEQLRNSGTHPSFGDGDEYPSIHVSDKDWIIAQVLQCIEKGKEPIADIIYGGYQDSFGVFGYNFKTKKLLDLGYKGGKICNEGYIKKELLSMLNNFNEGARDFMDTNEVMELEWITYTNKQIELVKKYL